MHILGLYLGTPLYLALVWAISAVLLTVGVLIFRKNIRVRGITSWIALLVFGGAGGLLAMPLVDILNLGIWYAVPLFAMGSFVSVPWIHFGVTKLARDMNIDVFAASLMLGFLVGIAVVIAGFISGEVQGIGPIDLF